MLLDAYGITGREEAVLHFLGKLYKEPETQLESVLLPGKVFRVFSVIEAVK